MKMRQTVFPISVAWVWSMVFIGLVLYSLAYFVFGRVIWEVILAVEAGYSFPEPSASVLNVVKYVLAFHPLFALFGWLLWGYLNSMKRDVRSYEY